MGAESCEAFTSKNITGVNIVFTPGENFQDLINQAEFKLVASRNAQTATLKAEKMGESTVDLASAKNKNNNSSTDPSDPGTDPSDPGTGDEGGNDAPPLLDGDDNGGGSNDGGEDFVVEDGV